MRAAEATDGSGPAPQLVYVKKDSRRSTREGSLAASRPVKLADKWHVIGPFDNEGGRGFAQVYPPEQDPAHIDLAAEYEGAGELAAWRELSLSDGRVNNLRRFKRNDNVLCYLYRRIEVPAAQRVRVSLGCDEGLVIWLNGRMLYSVQESRIAALPNQDFVTLDLRPGTNDLLVKVINGRGLFGFYFEPTLPHRLLAELDRRLERDFPSGGEGEFYRIEPLPLPDDEVIEVGALAFRPDGKLYVATRRGDIWLVSNPTSDDVNQITWKRFASGLHEVLGLCVVGPREVLAGQRPEITLLRDADADDEADEFVTVCDRFGISGDYHEFLYGPARDRDGNLFISLNLGFGGGEKAKVPYRGSLLRVGVDSAVTPWATGMRSPNGLAFDPQGRLFFTDNQGEWIAACKLQEVRQGEFYGNPEGLRYWPGASEANKPEYVTPTLWFPFGLCRSATEPLWDTSAGKFGPFAGQCFVGELTNSLITRVYLEEIDGRLQGACLPFRRGFASGVNRLAQASDGSLLVGETNRGWGSLGGQTFGLERLTFTGRVPFELYSMSVTPSGWELRFTTPVDTARAIDPANYLVESYTYHYWAKYGSPEIGRRQHAVELQHSPEQPDRVQLVVLEPRELGRVYHVRMAGVRSTEGKALVNHDAYYTLNRLPSETSKGGNRNGD
ncbi:MAG: PQQ-dependent sugar dehydrogenase [Pirellulales bacterium]|nr:PQQ-dependent sugar dehydrogenase [Pirellulales bacterium]